MGIVHAHERSSDGYCPFLVPNLVSCVRSLPTVVVLRLTMVRVCIMAVIDVTFAVRIFSSLDPTCTSTFSLELKHDGAS